MRIMILLLAVGMGRGDMVPMTVVPSEAEQFERFKKPDNMCDYLGNSRCVRRANRAA